MQDNIIYDNLWGINSGQHRGSSSGTETIIRGNKVHNNANDGIHVRANYWIVEENKVYDNGTNLDEFLGIHLYSGSPSEGTCKNNIIRRNIVYNQKGTREDGAGIGVDQWCDNNEISYNIAYHNDGPGIYLFDATNCSILNNVAYGNSQNSSTLLTEKGEIRLTSSGEPNDLTNNILVINNIAYATTNGSYAIYIDDETIKNNVIFNKNNWYRSSGNWYFWGKQSGSNLASWNSYQGAGNDFNADPMFTDSIQYNFRLRSGSPGIDTGIYINISQDIIGNTVPQGDGTDIGAFEYQNMKKPTPPSSLKLH